MEKPKFEASENDRINGLTGSEKERIADFLNSVEGRQKIGKILKKVPEDVTEGDALSAYNKFGQLLFAKEIKLDEMTPGEIKFEEEKWGQLTKEKKPKDPGSYQKAA